VSDPTSLAAGLSLGAWLILVAGALLIGFAKTALGTFALVSVALFALVLPARESTGAILVLLIVGDIVAVSIYRKDVDWKLILRLVVPVLVGVGLGALFLSLVDDLVLKRTIGVILIILTIIGFWPDRLRAERPAVAAGYGSLAGFTTMVANAGGPPMNLYLLAARYDKWRFMGTTAWFFFFVNLTKVPVSVGLGMIRPETLVAMAPLVPAVLLGTWIGRITIKRIDQKLFNTLVTVMVAISALYLLLF
jgi:uncharacterized membrane protein YfcA